MTSHANPADALQAKPDATHGVLIGLGDWRLAVEILLPVDPSSSWNVGKWGTAQWSELEWRDLSPFVRGLEWQRGAEEFDGRPRIGVAAITLENLDRQFSPWNAATAFAGAGYLNDALELEYTYFGPGTLVRVVAHSPSGQTHPITAPGTLSPSSDDSWAPQFAGEVETWTDATVGIGADAMVEVTVIETLSRLALVDDDARPLEGNNDLPAERFQRLGDAARWPYGYESDHYTLDVTDPQYNDPDHYRLQSTNMSANRLAELYLAADSTLSVVRSGRDGRMFSYSFGPYGYTASRRGPERDQYWFSSLGHTPELADGQLLVEYVADSVTVANDALEVRNVARVAKVGGSVVELEDAASRSRRGRRVYERSDLICKADEMVTAHAQDVLRARANAVSRFDTVQLHSAHTRALVPIIGLDVHTSVFVYVDSPAPEYEYVRTLYMVDAMRHAVTPLNGAELEWTAELTLGRQISGFQHVEPI